MKILLVSEFFPIGKQLDFTGGVEARNYFVAKYLSKKHRVIILTRVLEGVISSESLDGIEILRVGPKGKYQAATGDFISRIKFVLSAIRESKNIDADLVEGSNFLTHFIAKQISNKKNIPVVAWYPDVWVGKWIKNSSLIGGLLGEVVERFNLMRHYNQFIAISKQTADKLNKLGVTKVKIIYCGVDKNEFSAKIQKYPNPTVVCIARLTPYKNHTVLIKAFSKVLKEVPTANLVLIGRGPEYTKITRLINDLGLEKNIKIISNLPRKELTEMIQRCHIFCLPSLVEGFGISTIEACCAGLPYISSDIAITKEITHNGKGGFLVDPYDDNKYAEKIIDLLKDEALYKSKSKEAINLSNYYNWEQLAQQTEALYFSVLKESR